MSSTAYTQEGTVCARPECNNPLNKGKFYCSNPCAALDRARVKALNASRSKLSSDAMEFIPADAQKQFLSITGDDGVAVLDEIALAIRENAPIVAPPLRAGLTVSGDDIYRYGVLRMDGNKSYRASDALSYGTIGDMMKNGQVIFSLALKQSAISGVLSRDRSWKVICQNERMAEVVRGIMSRVFRRSTHEMMEYIPYGAAFFEKEWDYRSAAYWGIEEGVRGKFYGYEDLKSIHPQSIDHIRYVNKGKEFNGFVQKPPGRAKDIPVPRELSFILTYDQKWRNLWGNPATDSMYPYWFWLEVAWRSFMRYLERTGNPVVVVYAPSKGKVLGPDSVSYPSMQYALLQAAYVVKSNAAAFPSDTDPDSGNKLWEIEYLNDQQKGDQFLGAIDKLSLMLNRSVVIGDTAATQQGDTGSFAMSRSHLAVTQMHSSMVLSEALQQINDYLVDPVVRYNGSVQSPPARIEAVTLDPEHKERLFKLLSIMGNQQESSPMRQVDWVRVMSDSEIPALTEEEIDDEFDKELERSKAKQKQAAEIQNKMAAPQEKKLSPGQKRPILNSMEWQMYQIAQGAHIPVLISDEQRQELEDRLVPRDKVFDMGIALQKSDRDREIDRIIDEIMKELTEGEDPTKDELDELRQIVTGRLGFRKSGDIKAKQLTFVDDLAFELGLGDFLKRVVKKLTGGLIDKIVKKVTGKTLNRWRKQIVPVAGDVYTTSDAVVVTRKDGSTYIWRPQDHPRDASGRWTSKGQGGEPPAEVAEYIGAQGATGDKLHRALNNFHFLENLETRLKASPDVSDFTMEKEAIPVVRRAMEKALQDPYFAQNVDLDKLRVVMNSPSGGFAYDPKTDVAYYPINGTNLGKYPENSIIHEMIHSIAGDDPNGRHNRGQGEWYFENRGSFEEPMTELLAIRAGQLPSGDIGERAYKDITGDFVYTMRLIHGDDREKIWEEIEKHHYAGSKADTYFDILAEAYKLSNAQKTRFRIYADQNEYAGRGAGFSAVYREVWQIAMENKYGKDWRYSQQQHYFDHNEAVNWLANGESWSVQAPGFSVPVMITPKEISKQVEQIAKSDKDIPSKANDFITVIEEEAKKIWKSIFGEK